MDIVTNKTQRNGSLFVVKGFNLEKSDTINASNEKSRVVQITAGCLDRDNEIVRPDGIDFSQFDKNPVVLFAHDYHSIPVGKCVWHKPSADGKGIIAKTIYNNTELASEIHQLSKDGFPLAVSIGFVPLEYLYRGQSGFDEQVDFCISRGWLNERDSGSVKCIYTKVSMLEYSDVPVPSNPEALQLMISKGWKKEEVKALTHNSKVSDSEPSWGAVDKTKLPRNAFADPGDENKKSTWKYPHHWVKNGGELDENGVFSSGDMYLHKGGLNAAWAAAHGARSGQQASASVISHLKGHRDALGLDDKDFGELTQKEIYNMTLAEAKALIAKEEEGHPLVKAHKGLHKEIVSHKEEMEAHKEAVGVHKEELAKAHKAHKETLDNVVKAIHKAVKAHKEMKSEAPSKEMESALKEAEEAVGVHKEELAEAYKAHKETADGVHDTACDMHKAVKGMEESSSKLGDHIDVIIGGDHNPEEEDDDDGPPEEEKSVSVTEFKTLLVEATKSATDDAAAEFKKILAQKTGKFFEI